MGLFSRLSLSKDMGIDLGTANTLIYLSGKGIVLQEPSVIAIDQKDKVPLAVGEDAKKMLGRTPGNVLVVRPLRDGVIADFDTAELMLKHFIQRVHDGRTLVSPRIVIGHSQWCHWRRTACADGCSFTSRCERRVLN